MKKRKRNYIYYNLLHKFALDYANNLCEFELLSYKFILNKNYSIDDFKKELFENFVFNTSEIKKIYKTQKNKYKHIL